MGPQGQGQKDSNPQLPCQRGACWDAQRVDVMDDDRVLDSCTNLMFYHINTCVTLREDTSCDKWMPVS